MKNYPFSPYSPLAAFNTCSHSLFWNTFFFSFRDAALSWFLLSPDISSSSAHLLSDYWRAPRTHFSFCTLLGEFVGSHSSKAHEYAVNAYIFISDPDCFVLLQTWFNFTSHQTCSCLPTFPSLRRALNSPSPVHHFIQATVCYLHTYNSLPTGF